MNVNIKKLEYLVVFMVILFTHPLKAQSVTIQYAISGQIQNAEGKKIYLTQRGRGMSSATKVVMTDSATIHNGQFTLRGFIPEPNYYAILLEGKKNWKSFILDQHPVTIKVNADSIWTSEVKGSPAIELYKEYANTINPIIKRQNEAAINSAKARQQGDTLKAAQLLNQNRLQAEALKNVTLHFIKTNAASIVSLLELKYISSDLTPTEGQEAWNKLSNDLKAHSVGQELEYKFFKMEANMALGRKAPPFIQATIDGKPLRLDSLKGKITLLNFWASWCGPCRQEHPLLKSIYDKYHGKGLVIIGISLDHNAKAWKEAIKEDHLEWINLSDLKGGKNEVARLYGVTLIPENFLLNDKGEIIRKGFRITELEQVLSAYLQ